MQSTTLSVVLRLAEDGLGRLGSKIKASLAGMKARNVEAAGRAGVSVASLAGIKARNMEAAGVLGARYAPEITTEPNIAGSRPMRTP